MFLQFRDPKWYDIVALLIPLLGLLWWDASDIYLEEFYARIVRWFLLIYHVIFVVIISVLVNSGIL